ncbi:ECF transporter S component [Mycoplasmopsis pullorum]|uniref:ECF transporter S component n=2 Tax=Mycoplasmopsis pullorum TaxID=48003 RepID=UPI00111A1EE2|nr:ECF transporter S component [Mycoplasmopsis pullorum]TNK82437.1 ECF transporter S component [Mycoplasmopsis pullorum]TNK84178.1 ECF transporter S component [Mycoplasmopsis pullorum]TNK86813.1 ECF transporter S component [Mycoplasmopsis pullorum]TNK89147.1 ECF transporter S component [Mycoplasmopsis pullorum]TNK89483.1 ECF transporter S component [Mycoplasmopsis pullorum]
MKRKPPILPAKSAHRISNKWTIRKMVFVAILIAISVTFTIVGSQIVPFISIASFKFSFIGLPVKISGLIFGPFIGFFVGSISDLLSLLFVPPGGWHILYTLATGMNGFVAGVIGWFFLVYLKYYFGGEFRIENYYAKIYKLNVQYEKYIQLNKINKAEKVLNKIIFYDNKIQNVKNAGTMTALLNINLIISIIMMLSVIIFISIIIGIQVDSKAFVENLIKNRWITLAFMISGTSSMTIFIIVARFKLSPSRYLIAVPIIVMSAFLELINIPILSIADNISLGSGTVDKILDWIVSHVLMSPVKIWFNLLVIYYSYSVISSLVFKNQNLSY